MKKKRYTEEQIIGILREVESGTGIAEVCRRYEVSEATVYRWREKYRGLDREQLHRLKELEAELRARIRRLALDHRAYGCAQITYLLRREGVMANKKRIHRLWKAEGLQQPRRSPRKRWCGPKGEVLKKA